MRNTKKFDDIGRNVRDLSLEDLRCRWQEAWGLKPHLKIGRTMLIKSLEYKFQESQSTLSSEQRERLKKLTAHGKSRRTENFPTEKRCMFA